MKPFLRWTKFAALLIAFLLGAWFALENSASVAVSLFGFPLPALSLGVWLLLFTGLGVVLGFVFSLPPLLALKRRIKARERQLAHCEKELTQLRLQPVRD